VVMSVFVPIQRMPVQDPRLTTASATSLALEGMLRVVGESSLTRHLLITDKTVEPGPSTSINQAPPLLPLQSRPLPYPPPQPLPLPPRHQLPRAGITSNAVLIPSNAP
jgi:hypothetical protein